MGSGGLSSPSMPELDPRVSDGVRHHQTPSDTRRVGGWLLLLARLLILFQPLNLAVVAASATSAIAVRGAPVVAVLVLRLLVTAFGVAAGIALQNLRPGAVTLTKFAIVASALA